MDISLFIYGGIALVLALALFLAVVMRARDVRLTDSKEDQPEWMRETPPPETRAAMKKDREGMTATFDHDRGERLAAPFAEQIEDILRARLDEDPSLKGFDVDLGTAPDGGLEIWINGQRYSGIEDLPDERLKQAFRQAVERWNTP